MSTGLASRLQDITGVDSVVVDLTESGGGINVRLEPGADEAMVMDKVRSLLVAYGVRSPGPPKLRPVAPEPMPMPRPMGIDVSITPLDNGARVEVSTKKVKSFRVVAATPSAIAQGIADAWCQVIGRIPVEVVRVSRSGNGRLTVAVSDGQSETVGAAELVGGWEDALAQAVGAALDDSADYSGAPMAVNS